MEFFKVFLLLLKQYFWQHCSLTEHQRC